MLKTNHSRYYLYSFGHLDFGNLNLFRILILGFRILSAVGPGYEEVLPLPVAGLMTLLDCKTTAEAYQKLDRIAKELGSKLGAPYMTLSFMALLVIPELKLSDLGLFDGKKFQFITNTN